MDTEEHKHKIYETVRIDNEYEEKFGDNMKGKYKEEDEVHFVLEHMIGNRLYLDDIHKEEHERQLRAILDHKFKRTSVVIIDGAFIDSGTYTKWETPWDFSFMYGEGDIDCWVIEYGDTLPTWGPPNYATISIYMDAIPRIILQMEADPKKLITKSASVIVLEKELNMIAKLHHSFGCWYLRPVEKDTCPIDGMYNDPFNITISRYTISEWTFDVMYIDDTDYGKDFGQSISDIFKRIYS